MQHIYLKKVTFFKLCTYPLCALLLFLGTIDLKAQSCECTNCGAFVGPLSNATFDFFAEGAVNNDLSDPGQGICGIVIDFVPDHIWSVEMTLTSPGGQTITLIGSQSFQLGVTGPQPWSISFVPCGDPAMPDPGFTDVWDNNQNWLLSNPYSGSYYPHLGCLEDFNTGTVDGNWTLTVDNSHPLNTVEIIDFTIIFCDAAGLGCFECSADPGVLDTLESVKVCLGDSSLIFDIDPIYQGSQPDSSLYGYTYIIARQDTIVEYDTLPDLINYVAGEYIICGLSYLLEDTLSFPDPNDTVTVTQLRDTLIGANPPFCGAITTDCFRVGIYEADTIFIIDTICLGDTLFFDTLVLDQTGVYQLDYFNQLSCDSTIIIDLTVQAPVVNQFRDTVCVDEPYFFNEMWLQTSGNYFDTLLTTAGCDSFVNLGFLRLDSIMVNEEAIICKGDSFPVGNNYFDSTGIYNTTLTTAMGCDSLVSLNLIVLAPQINIAPVAVLDCNILNVLIDASGSSGEALIFQWFDLVNGGAGIVSGENEPILEVNLPGNYLLILTDTLGGIYCDTSAIIVVSADYAAPLINITGGTIDCSNSPIQINTDTITFINNYDWIGPNGFSATEEDPWVDLPGEYAVTVTGTNGCIDSFSIIINADTIAPVILSAMVSDTLTCDAMIVQLSGSASPGTIIYHWTGPGGFDVNISNPVTNLPGDYTFTVEAANGCTHDTTITVFQNIEIPVIQIQEDILGCPPDTIQLFSNSSIPGSSFSWIGPGTYSSNEQNPLITDAGFYGITVTAPNGCSESTFINILEDIEIPILNILGDTLGCAPDTIIIQSSSSILGSTFSWTGPLGFTATISNPEVTAAGIYNLLVTAPNGCEATGSIIITA
ncbi:MAG: hypothetical protein ACI8VT_000369, partial [Saprospiraceae bacterium]